MGIESKPLTVHGDVSEDLADDAKSPSLACYCPKEEIFVRNSARIGNSNSSNSIEIGCEGCKVYVFMQSFGMST
ncbi:hypothetical protein SLA2020_236940 [Shorea laevis]